MIFDEVILTYLYHVYIYVSIYFNLYTFLTGETMDEHYGLNPSEKQELYGRVRGSTPTTGRANGTNPFDVEEGGSSSDIQIPATGNHPSAATTQNGNSNLHSDIYQHATSSNNAGVYGNKSNNNTSSSGMNAIDDYSFSNVNLSSPGQVGHPTTPNNNARTTKNNKGSATILQWLGNALSSGKKDQQHPHLPPNMTPNTNIAPRSPQVAFANDFHPSGILTDKRKGSGYWNRLGPAQKVGMAVIWVAFLCTIFGVTISELRKTNSQDVPSAASGDGDGIQARAFGVGQGQGQGQGMPQLAPPAPDGGDTPTPTPWPEEDPEPTSEPTTRSPTRQPVTSSPVAGYYAVHGKQSDGTSHPTRSPVTATPTTPPTTSSPTTKEPTTAAPSSASPSVSIQAVQSVSAPAAGNTVPSATVSCSDKSGFFMNHLLNPKNCAWLDNGKSGTTDRKTKNCGGTIVEEDGSTASYPTTELGTMCPYTCGLYNGCDGILASMSVVQSMQNNNALDTNDNEDNECSDENGEFKNHLLNPKTCEWLDNDKDGHTDRKDKNCGGRPVVDEVMGGTVVYPTTELGNKCRKTCGLYNGCGASGAAMTAMSATHGSSKENKPSCHDLDGTFVNHLANPKTCEWLFNDKPGQTDRKDKNCGHANYPVTLLGLACPKTCSWYNNDSGCDEVLGEITTLSNGNFMRSFSSPNYSFSMSSPITTASSSNTCTDGSEEYLDHKHAFQSCTWLRGNGHADGNVGRHRQEKNCGSSSHAITELGRECPYTCREYNDCGS